MVLLTNERKHNIIHLGFITKGKVRYTLIWDNKMYQVPMPGGKKMRVTLGALRKAGWVISPWEHATEEGLRLLNGEGD